MPPPSLRTTSMLLFAATMALAPVTAGAQAPPEAPPTGLASLLPRLILSDIRLAPAAGFSHDAHFSPLFTGDLESAAIGIVDSFNTLMTLQLSTFPLGSSAGGFTYTFDPTVGTFRRATTSFGPSFAERATTIGRRRVAAGFAYQHTSYNQFEGLSLDDGSIKFYLRHRDCCGGGPTLADPDGTNLNLHFEGDLIEAALSMKVKTDTVALFATYGVSDHLDIGVAVPIVHVTLDASVLATVQRLATATTPTLHTFEQGNPNAVSKTFRTGGSATGVGDVVVRAKYRLLGGEGGGGLAAAADLRLPTGDEQNLLGGGTQSKLYLIASRGGDRFAQHVNLGFTASGGVGRGRARLADLPNELNYAGGVEFVATPRLTLLGDVVGRTLPDVGRLRLASKTFQFTQTTPAAVMQAQFDEFEPQPGGSLNLLFGTVGAKFNPFGNLLISGSILFPLTDGGLRNRLTTTIGIDYAF